MFDDEKENGDTNGEETPKAEENGDKAEGDNGDSEDKKDDN